MTLLAKAFDPDEPRDEGGKWSDGGGGSGGASSDRPIGKTDKAAHDVSDEPRDPGGKWTDGGGDGGGGSSGSGGGKGKHPGPGYSPGARVDSKGVIQTSNVYDAQRALFEDRKVELKQVKQISTLIKRLGETAKEMAEHGETAPTFNLCNVSVKGTNLFCADQIGIPRVEMPVIKASKTKDFIKYLKKQGYKVENDKEEARNLRATQSEISGEKVAASMARIKEEGFYKRLVVSKDDYILDGHHTWAGQLAVDAEDGNLKNDGREVKIARVNISITKLVAEAEKWTGGKGKKPATEKPKGYRLISLRQAESELDRATYQKFADVTYRFFALNGHLARSFERVMITVPESREWDKAAHDVSDEPRDPGGKWTDGGGGGGGSSSSSSDVNQPTAADIARELDPAVINVGGDEWNKQTAIKLETQYQKARDKLDKIAKDSPGKSLSTSGGGGEESYIETWDEMSGQTQEDAEQQYYDQNFSNFLENEQQNWSENDANNDAAYEVAREYNDEDEVDWARDAITELRDDREEAGKTPWPFTDDQLLGAISIGNADDVRNSAPEFEFDDTKLQEPKGYDPNQQTLPGIEPVKPEDMLDEKMRNGIKAALSKAFIKATDEKVNKMEPPDYLSDSAKESMEMYWSDMDDESKFNWTKSNTDLIKDENANDDDGEPVGSSTVDALPKNYDPLNTTSGQDYKRTQALARYLSIKRAVDVLVERPAAAPEIDGMEKFSPEWKAAMEARLQRVDRTLWAGWKASSTTTEGRLLQVATAFELGGRLNEQTSRDIGVKEMMAHAEDEYANIGGWAGVRAYVRAKWETTQYLLDKAGLKTLQLYRGIDIGSQKFNKMYLQRHYNEAEKVQGFIHMPTLDVLRNGAASTSVSPDVANDWGSGGNRVVLRAEVPRTAAVSIPAYGINVKSEQEVVVAGTAWHGWDAWAKKAPEFSEVPLQKDRSAAREAA